MKIVKQATDHHKFRLVNNYLTITQDASPPDANEGYVPAQTIWLDPTATQQLKDFLCQNLPPKNEKG